jgi:hypothetical protein
MNAYQPGSADDSWGPTAPVPGGGDPLARKFLGQWNRLISSTNWEKGRIIYLWRTAHVQAGSPARDYADDVWARSVGHVSSQHVGRLRRTYERYGNSYKEFSGLYWSHFYAALDWSDADEWLRQAQAGRWSVAKMRDEHWKSLGSPPDDDPAVHAIIDSELDEDLDEPQDAPLGNDFEVGEVSGGEAPPWEDESADSDEEALESVAADRVAQVRPFEDLPDLPDDLADAFEGFQLAVVRHRMTGWSKVSRDDVLAAIESLRKLVLAPTEAEVVT